MKSWYHRIRSGFEALNRAVTHRASVILFSFLYIIVMPLFALIARKKEIRRYRWYPWTLKSDTLDDLRKQY
jgi:hypothetical protein